MNPEPVQHKNPQQSSARKKNWVNKILDGLCFQILPIPRYKAMSNAIVQKNIGNNSKILMFYSKIVSVSQESSSRESFPEFPPELSIAESSCIYPRG